jgi:hypothetical protein
VVNLWSRQGLHGGPGGFPAVETPIPSTDQEKQDGSNGIGMDGAGTSGTSEFAK